MTEFQQQPKVSVLMSSYNYQDYIGAAIESVIAQTYQNWELVIIDDASTDDSIKIISGYQQKYPDKIKLLALPENKGVGYVGNLGIENSTGELIANLGSDDCMKPQRLEKQVTYLLANPKAGAVCSDVEVIDSEGNILNMKTVFSEPVSDVKRRLFFGNFLNSPSATVRKEVFSEIGYYSPVLDYVQDFDHWMRMLDKYEIVRLDEKLTQYRVHGKNLSAKQNNRDLAYAGSYETVIVILRGLRHEDDRISKEVHDAQELIRLKLQLAQDAMKAERGYLGSFKYSLAFVYMLMLDIQELDPHHAESKKILKDVYKALGDSPRAHGEKPITVGQYKLACRKSEAAPDKLDNKQLFNEESMLAGSLLETAITTAQRMDQSLPSVIASWLNRKELKYLPDLSKQDLLLQLTEFLIADGLKNVDYANGKMLNSKGREKLWEAYCLFNEQFDSNKQTAAIIETKTQLRKLIEHDEYQSWIRNHELREVDAEVLAERMFKQWHAQPVLHCFLFVLPAEFNLLADTVDSLAAQFYKDWQLTVVAFTPSPDPMFEQTDFLHWRMVAEDEDPYDALNQEIARVPSHWVTFIEPGLQYSQHSLAKIADAINLKAAASFIYTDDDQLDSAGVRQHPRFKPEFNLDLLRSSPYIGNSWVPASHLIQLDGILALPGAENYDLALRWYDAFGEAVFHHITDVLTHKSAQVDRPFDVKAGQQALEQHFARQQIPVQIEPGYVNNSFHVSYLQKTQPLVSIIIPSRDKLEFLQPCLETLLEKTSYPNYEVLLVDNQSQDVDVLAYYDELLSRHAKRVKILYYDKPFNFSDMNNWAAGQANGDLLLLLNNDMEIIQPDWLSRMVMVGQREDVGVVGARLIYPESGTIQHTGVILGIGGGAAIAHHPYLNRLTLKDSSYMDRAELDQNLSAVTAAMMLVKKRLYLELGGMDAENLAVLYNDADFCLRVKQSGYRIVYTPYAIAVHHGNTSVGEKSVLKFYRDWQAEADKSNRLRAEHTYMLKHWLPELANDPAYNPNLSFHHLHYAIECGAPLNWETAYSLRPKCYGVAVKGGSGDYRMRQPFEALAQQGSAMCEYGERKLSVTELARMRPDTVVFQNALSDADIEIMRLYREFCPDINIIFLLDDLFHDVPEKSAVYKSIKGNYRDAKTRLRKAMSYCDRLIVSTLTLTEICQDMIEDIQVVPNRLRKADWTGLTVARNQGEKLRVGWAGAQQHQGDLDLIIDVVKATADKVDWVFMGMCPDDIRPCIKEFHQFVPIADYPQKLASLALDLAIAPLEVHAFNEAKSNLRLLEYGVLGWPVICTDIYPYRTNNPPVIHVTNDSQAWIEAIEQAIAHPERLKQAGQALQEWVLKDYILEDHLDDWSKALFIE